MAQAYQINSDVEEPDNDSRSDADSISSFFERFTFEILDADAVLKVKKRSRNVKLSTKCTFQSPRSYGAARQDWSFAVRPIDPYKNWRTRTFSKIALNPVDKTLTWSVAKLRWKWFQWKFGVQFDWETKRLLWRYRVTSKWNTEGSKAFRKEKVALASNVLLQPHYSLDFELPAVEGGNSNAAAVEQPELHFELSRVDLVLDVDNCSFEPFWLRKSVQKKLELLPTKGSSFPEQPAEVGVVTEHGTCRARELASRKGTEPSELWMTHSPDSAYAGRIAKPEVVAADKKSLRPIPWCLDNPLLFPWLRRNQT